MVIKKQFRSGQDAASRSSRGSFNQIVSVFTLLNQLVQGRIRLLACDNVLNTNLDQIIRKENVLKSFVEYFSKLQKLFFKQKNF